MREKRPGSRRAGPPVWGTPLYRKAPPTSTTAGPEPIRSNAIGVPSCEMTVSMVAPLIVMYARGWRARRPVPPPRRPICRAGCECRVMAPPWRSRIVALREAYRWGGGDTRQRMRPEMVLRPGPLRHDSSGPILRRVRAAAAFNLAFRLNVVTLRD